MWSGSAPDHAGGDYSASPDSIAALGDGRRRRVEREGEDSKRKERGMEGPGRAGEIRGGKGYRREGMEERS